MAADELTAGTVLDGTYELIAELGAGGMGVVWRAKHLRLPKEVAVKVLRGVLGSEPEVYARFRREAEIASQLGHPNIVEALDFNVLPDGSPYLVLELLRGQSLRQLVAQGPLPLERALVITSQIAAGLRAAHRREIVHRDLKPENIFLCQQEQEDAVLVKILDFGISKIHHSQSLQTREGVLMGTPHYMAPEQATGGSVDARTDQFALAAMAFEMVTGRGPFFAEQPLQVLYQVVHADAPKASELRAGLPPAFDEVLQRALAKDQTSRYANVTELAKALWEASGMVAPREAWALLSSTTHEGASASPADGSLGSAPTIASEPSLVGSLGTAPTIDSGRVLTGPVSPGTVTTAASSQTGPTRPQPLSLTGPPSATDASALANAPTIAQDRPPLASWQTGPIPSAPSAGRGLGLVLVVALLASLGGGAMVWWLTRTPTAKPVVTARGAVAARVTPRPDRGLRRADAGGRANRLAPDQGTPSDMPVAKRPVAKQPVAKQPVAKQPKKPKKPIVKKPRHPTAPAVKLSSLLRSRLAAAERLLAKGDYRGTILQAERILRDLPSQARWRAHRLLTLGYCGKLELTNVRGYYRLLPRHVRRATQAHCKRLGTPFEP